MLKDASVRFSGSDVQAVADKLAEFSRGLPTGQQMVVAGLQRDAKSLAEDFEVAGFGASDGINVLDQLGFSRA